MPVAEMDVELAEPIAAALHAAVDRSDTGYPATDGVVQAAFLSFAEQRWDWTPPADQVRLAPDVSVAAVEVLRLSCPPESEVVISSPVYPPFHHWPAAAGLRVVDVPMLDHGPQGGWGLDLSGIEAAFAAGAQAYLLCHPHNPLGHLHPAAELVALADLAQRYGALIVSDEIHAPLTLPGATFTPFLTVSQAARRHGVALHSASKAWNLAGLKSALIVTDGADPRHRLSELPRELAWHSGHFGAIAATVAYTEAVDWLAELGPVLAANHELLVEQLAAELPLAVYRPGPAGYLAWVDCRDLGWGENPADPALKLGRLALGIGPHFGPPGRGHVRINLGCSPDLIPEAVRRLVRTDELLRAHGKLPASRS